MNLSSHIRGFSPRTECWKTLNGAQRGFSMPERRSRARMIIDAGFLREFDLRFNGDLIRLNDHGLMIEDAESVTRTVAVWPDAETILTQPDYVLRTRNSEEVVQFSIKRYLIGTLTTRRPPCCFDILTALRDRLRTHCRSGADDGTARLRLQHDRTVGSSNGFRSAA